LDEVSIGDTMANISISVQVDEEIAKFYDSHKEGGKTLEEFATSRISQILESKVKQFASQAKEQEIQSADAKVLAASINSQQ
jgi:hypothetical protein